jgi:uncharacterized membrane protein YhdT
VSLVGLAMMAFGVVALRMWSGIISGLCIFLPASGLAALGAYLGRSRYRRFLYGALGLTACVPITLILIISPLYFEGFPRWWEIVVWTYPLGLIMSCVGAVLVIFENLIK